jgi:methylglutaconyl-CoA hydratase
MPDILISEDAGVRTITLNRPERRNALTQEMQVDLIEAFREADDSATTRVVVLTGAGDAFCAGLDLTSLQRMQDKSALTLSEDAHRLQKLFRTLYELPVPTIAAVNGHAVAGGTGLATLCDFTLAVPAAKFGYTEVKIGFVPALVSAYLSLQVGEKQARNLLLTGRLFTAEEALGLGLVTEIVPPEELQARVRSLTEILIANSPSSLRATKNLLTDQNRAWLDAAMHVSMQANARSRETPDFREGIAAFLEKRKPTWS